MGPGWSAEFLRLGGIIALALAGGWFLGHPWPFLAAGLAVYLGRHLYMLARLSRSLGGSSKSTLPEGSGAWRPVYRGVNRLRLRGRKRKRRLARFLSRFQEAAGVFPDAAVVLGRDMEVRWCNPAAEALLGLRWPASAGARLTSLLRDPVLEEYLEQADFRQPLELPAPRNPARVLSMQIATFGRKRERLLVARDVTQVHNIDRVRRDFVANVSHELRTPLTVLSGVVEGLAQEAEFSADVRRQLELMQTQSRRMETLIEDLLTLSRLELEDDQVRGDPVAMAPLVESVVDEARRLSGARAHRIETHVDPDLRLLGREAELRSAVSNLVFNAVRHTPPRSEVNVRWAGEGEGACLEVRDNGLGFSARHVPRLSERFYRVDDGRSRATGGTGLGLAIVKHVLEGHDAELRISSTPGRGSVFSCHFPAERVFRASR